MYLSYTYTSIIFLLLTLSESILADEKFQLYKAFYEFAVQHNRPYLKNSNSSEFLFRFNVFKENVAKSQSLNEDFPNDSTQVYGINKFADLSPEEFKAKYLSTYKPTKGLRKNLSDLKFVKFQDLPTKKDWRDSGVVNPVMDQGSCGACWAFSVVETVESMYGIQKNASAPSLSVQELIDCDKNNSGCEGGSIKGACDWSLENGLVWSDQYPLTDKTGSCRNLSSSLPRVHLKACENNQYTSDENQLLQLLAFHGPIAVAIDATTWHNYIGGIIQFHCYNNLNHAVQIVGYNLEGDVPYYIIRNSWGTNFGDQGYIYVKYGKNLCGLTYDVTILDVDLKRNKFP
ncbi:cathepsin O [Biomphalaria pfeifferi]|uniref:Cathepsin O n=1 Tax=Biomphalaria pfeifferi TaxID=112525 RepID=A0AAD8AUR0_BIOPF|nr:cathepsin O [Biomphalaria pfeifferi]